MMIQANVIITIAFLVGVIWLQIFLSRRENKWPGLILPILIFLFSIFSVLMLTPWQVTTYINGEHIQTERVVNASVGQMILVLIWWNISTAILLMIYFACRQKIRKKKALEKMTIKDLG